MRVARTVNLTPDQVRAQLRLFTAISAAQQDGLAVPCTDDPPSWDKESMNPGPAMGAPCLSCARSMRLPGRCATASSLAGMPVK